MISIIIPTRDEGKTIAKHLRSIKEGIKNIAYEIIISDNLSRDNTIEEVAPYANQVVLNPSTEGGISAARNRGAKAAKYPYLVFIDGGVDIPNMEHFFHKLLDNFKKMPDVVAMTVNIRFLPSIETLLDKIILISFDWWFIFSNNILKSGAANGKFQMIKADAFKKLGGYNESLAASEDFDMFRRLAKIGGVYSDPSLTVYHEGRRAKQLGWFKLLPLWIINGIWVGLFNRSWSKKWTPVR